MAGAEGCPNCARLEARVGKLEERVQKAEAEAADLRHENLRLRQENQKLQARLERLEERLNRNSTNSSRPPSSDPPQIKQNRPPQPPTGRKPGGQPGHEGHTRELLPLEQVDELIELDPKRCGGCGRKFKRRDVRRSRRSRTLRGRARRHQVTEIPEPQPHTTEWRMHAVECADPECGAVTWAELPPEVPRGRFGPRVQATVATLTGRYRSSRREAQVQIEELHGVKMSLGEVGAIERNVSTALARPVKEAQQYAQTQPVAGSDESGWPQGKRAGKRRAWLWVMVTNVVTVFLILRHRSAEAARTLLGSFDGVLCTDRWWAYKGWPLRKRQLCWAHLVRDFTEFTERSHKASRQIGEALLEEARRMFAWWYRVRDGTLSRESFQTYRVPLRRRVRRLLRKGARCGHKLTARTCRDILALEPALWTFARVRGVEPTNNACERALRPAVLWRKGCFGTRSAAGSRFVQRMLTVAATLKQQGRSLLDFLTLAVELHQNGERAPSLLPDAYTFRQLEATA